MPVTAYDTFTLSKKSTMEKRTIELELRAEIEPRELARIRRALVKKGRLRSHTKRLSVMYFQDGGSKNLDIRVRITNGASEVVMKTGAFGSHDRTELPQKIGSDQFLGMVRIFAQLGFKMKVGERETFNYALPGGIVISVVSAGPVAYVELEKMSSPSEIDRNKKKLEKIAEELRLTIMSSDKDFDMICSRLDETVDWKFLGSDKDYKTLANLLRRYKK